MPVARHACDEQAGHARPRPAERSVADLSGQPVVAREESGGENHRRRCKATPVSERHVSIARPDDGGNDVDAVALKLRITVAEQRLGSNTAEPLPGPAARGKVATCR